ncbi:hypothetical protein Tco_0925226 [Tanacetum coccineum]|uniref:Uncharacterized protein n=1 Tax=Tanacetum coccineum TaxID=301880 RepID=A0ABQ5D7M2_9ASTR
MVRFITRKQLTTVYKDALKLKPGLSFEPTIDHDTNEKNETSLPKSNCEDLNSKAERKALRKRFSKKEKFNVLNIAEDLLSYEISSTSNLQLDKGIDDDKAGIEPFSEGSPSNTYVPNDEWKSIEQEINDPKQGSQESIGEYGLVINNDDLEHMCNYFLAKDAPSFINDMDERFDEKKLSLIGTPSDMIASLDKEFNNWAKANGFVNTSNDEIGICNVPPNGVFGNEVYGSDSKGFGMNPSSNEFRLYNSDEWRSVNHGGRVIIRRFGGGGDMVVCHGLKGCLDHRIIRSSPILPPLL